MDKIICTAQSFGFGPIAKLLAVSENIREARKIFFGSGVALDLARLHHFDEIYELTHSDSSKILALLNDARLFINVMDFPLGKLAKLAGCPYFLIDSLLWFWPELPEGVREADVYFCQSFFNSVEQKIREYQLNNACLIGPIISNNFCHYEKINQVIINFGGLENPHVEIGKNSNYPFVMLQNLLPILQQNFSSVLVAGRERVMEMCRQRFTENGRLKFKMLGQQEMMEELYRSEALCTAPGIQTFYDAHDKLPIFALPPQNNSNVKNLEAMVSYGAIQYYLKWEEFGNFDLTKAKDSSDGSEIRIVLESVSQFERSETEQDVLKSKIEQFLSAKDIWPDLLTKQKQAVEQLGPNGVKTIMEAINAVLNGNLCLTSFKENSMLIVR